MPSTLAVDKIKSTTGDTFTLPTADGSAGQIIKTDGSGVLSFTSDIDTGLLNMVEDTTPELGGDLDVNGKAIVSASNGDIAVTPNGNGSVIIDGLKHPQADGASGQYLKTDGSGQLGFATLNVDPTMGGDLSGTASNAQIVANAVTTTEILNDAVTTAKILDANVTTAKIANDGVTTVNVLDANITTAKIADDAITNAKMADNSIDTVEIVDAAVTAPKLCTGCVETAKIADNAVTGAKIAMGSDAAGDVLYYNGTDYVRLGVGTAGQVLMTNSGATAPEWGVASSFSETTVTPTANQTTFNHTYTAGKIQVFLNGVKLVGGGTDFTASNGTTVVFTAGVQTSDSVQFVNF